MTPIETSSMTKRAIQPEELPIRAEELTEISYRVEEAVALCLNGEEPIEPNTWCEMEAQGARFGKNTTVVYSFSPSKKSRELCRALSPLIAYNQNPSQSSLTEKEIKDLTQGGERILKELVRENESPKQQACILL